MKEFKQWLDNGTLYIIGAGAILWIIYQIWAGMEAFHATSLW